MYFMLSLTLGNSEKLSKAATAGLALKGPHPMFIISNGEYIISVQNKSSHTIVLHSVRKMVGTLKVLHGNCLHKMISWKILSKFICP